MKTFVKLIVLGLAIYGAWKLLPHKEPVVNVYLETDFIKAPDGIVGFPSWNASTAKELVKGPESAQIKVNGGGKNFRSTRKTKIRGKKDQRRTTRTRKARSNS